VTEVIHALWGYLRLAGVFDCHPFMPAQGTLKRYELRFGTQTVLL